MFPPSQSITWVIGWWAMLTGELFTNSAPLVKDPGLILADPRIRGCLDGGGSASVRLGAGVRATMGRHCH